MAETFPSVLKRVLPKIEMASLAIAVAGLLLLSIGRTEGSNLLIVGMCSLAAVFFLTAYMPSAGPPASDTATKTPKGFIDLAHVLILKVVYIGCSVETIGLLFYMLHFKGYAQILLIGTFSLFFSLLLSAFIISRKNEMLNILQNAIIRGGMLMLMGMYILYTHWPPES